MMELVVAVDLGWGIGNNGELLCRVSDDLKNFRAVTTGKTVILGSKTLSTFPGGRPLKNRRNIIMSRRPDYTVEGAEVAHSPEELLSMLSEDENAVVIGGESIYRLLLPYCDRAIVSKFDIDLPKDAFFPDLDADPDWFVSAQSETFTASETDSHPGMKWKICYYERKGENK
jgi:dihydrofolate reductase